MRWFLVLVASVITTPYKYIYILCTLHTDRLSLAGVVSLPINNCFWLVIFPRTMYIAHSPECPSSSEEAVVVHND